MMRETRAERRETEQGGITVLAMAVVSLMLMMVPVIVDVGLFLNARAQAENAADAAALAAAQEFFFEGDCPATAREYAERNGARLVGLDVGEDYVVARAEIKPRVILAARLGAEVPAVSGVGKAEIKFVKPAAGQIGLPFGHTYIDCDAGKRRTHCGIDILAAAGAPVWASAEGSVSFVGQTPAGGLTICIRHPNGIKTTYLQLGASRVAEGDVVHQGEAIGTVAAAGDKSSPLPHLHMGALLAGEYIDPELLFSGLFKVDLSEYIRRGDIPPAEAASVARAADFDGLSRWDQIRQWCAGVWEELLGGPARASRRFIGQRLSDVRWRLWFLGVGIGGLRFGARAELAVIDPSGDHPDGPRSRALVSIAGGGGAEAVAVYDGSGRMVRQLNGWAPPARGTCWDGLIANERIAEEGHYTIVVVPVRGNAVKCFVEVRYHLGQ